MTRVYKQRIDLEYSRLHEFFENRGKAVDNKHPLTSVLYQDNNPLLAESRDVFEKTKIVPLLNLEPRSRVLDIGCGIGRWADALAGRVASYHGIDFSAKLVDVARKRCQEDGFTFQVLAAQDIDLSIFPNREPFDIVLISGVLLYLNDIDVEKTLLALARCSRSQARIYIREPISKENRLTLKDFDSVELNASYNAIYRTVSEFLEIFEKCLVPYGYRLTFSDDLYPEEMNNRKETIQRIFLLER